MRGTEPTITECLLYSTLLVIVTVVSNMLKQSLCEMIDVEDFISHEIVIKGILLLTMLCRENDTFQG